eukprot:CAMPEP_0177207372 /NCGR_PEP_ID=MMETSP0367-20130122/29884_1 /TAXON_ID=447022 ORGANISM="Scrippsiella hangoei-like, Strain SHHI-4" /NCGR_SAMPLE_ID=MMETSP0367 /ASSEMBLY_ACC=CAM_ASM_000362 /LENGTH=83 /DNA_ID=CAMNT_0018656207 /DNA_START=57 /DNA_END=305 /DNA_ORIENTATION=-
MPSSSKRALCRGKRGRLQKEGRAAVEVWLVRLLPSPAMRGGPKNRHCLRSCQKVSITIERQVSQNRKVSDLEKRPLKGDVDLL